ncbi:hypothetical protein DYB25_009032 [Aphanomyces astaci]|uniref:Protein kinase domain-containing protein n=2 Tax=Aphanomyces astaci TaxID=112090 RepID=A0A397ARK4_APHAT|nr:hypothetical protein DYB36_000256 [Aphanomyces astaci]RHY08277.1 hypothetical protein DYB25_009032 [Aphanomyces astaci]RHY65805.1 hypothetical protein DYB30_004697 [Aphanomyces astaci]
MVFFIYRNQASKLRRRLAEDMVFGDRKSDAIVSRRSGHVTLSCQRRKARTAEWAVIGAVQPRRRQRPEVQDLLAKGANGEVWVGDYRGLLVAVKKSADAGKSDQDFIGVSWVRPGEIELVMEFMDRGDLRKYLESTKPPPMHNHAATMSSSSVLFPWSDKINIMRDVVEGLSYLHSVNIIHRDLKSRNVLLADKMEAKLSDFGISKEIDNDTMTKGVGTSPS